MQKNPHIDFTYIYAKINITCRLIISLKKIQTLNSANGRSDNNMRNKRW